MDNTILSSEVFDLWISEASSEKSEISLFSPYLSLDTVIKLCEVANLKYLRVYTRLEVEIFTSGASSISAIKYLLDHGVEVYEIEGLHAKILAFQNIFTIGSQNFTNSGISKNKEISIVLNKSVYPSSLINAWLFESKRVSKEDMIEIEVIVNKVQKEYDKVIEKVRNYEVSIKNSRKLRRNQELIKQSIAKYIEKSKQARESVIGKITTIDSSSWYSWSHVTTFFPNNVKDTDMTRWIVNDNEEKLQKTYRYLIYLSSNGKIGWARLMKTRITFICDGIETNLTLSNLYFDLLIEANWDIETLSDYNLILNISNHLYKIKFFCMFLLSEIQFLSFSAENDSKKFFIEHLSEIEKIVMEKVSTPFTYKSNLLGENADKFFELHKNYILKLYKNRYGFVIISDLST